MQWFDPKFINGVWIIEGSSFPETGAEIKLVENGTVNLYEITEYGTVIFDSNYPNVESAKKIAESWS